MFLDFCQLLHDHGLCVIEPVMRRIASANSESRVGNINHARRESVVKVVLKNVIDKLGLSFELLCVNGVQHVKSNFRKVRGLISATDAPCRA